MARPCPPPLPTPNLVFRRMNRCKRTRNLNAASKSCQQAKPFTSRKDDSKAAAELYKLHSKAIPLPSRLPTPPKPPQAIQKPFKSVSPGPLVPHMWPAHMKSRSLTLHVLPNHPASLLGRPSPGPTLPLVLTCDQQPRHCWPSHLLLLLLLHWFPQLLRLREACLKLLVPLLRPGVPHGPAAAL